MLQPGIADLARGPNFAIVTSISPTGLIQALPLWIDADDAGEHLLLNTEVHRQRYKNYERDKRATVTIIGKDSWYKWAEVRGEVVGEVRGPEARAHIDKLAQRYTGANYAPQITSERVILKVKPIKQLLRG